jgi:hypothetical protein
MWLVVIVGTHKANVGNFTPMCAANFDAGSLSVPTRSGRTLCRGRPEL